MRNKRRMSQPNLKESYRILWSGGGDGGGSGDAASYAMDKLPPRNKMGGLVAKNPRESYMDLGRLIRMKSFRGSGASLGISENPRESQRIIEFRLNWGFEKNPSRTRQVSINNLSKWFRKQSESKNRRQKIPKESWFRIIAGTDPAFDSFISFRSDWSSNRVYYYPDDRKSTDKIIWL